MEDKLYQIIEHVGQAMAAGSFHTPNYRWAIAAALSSCYNITGTPFLRRTLARHLNEGIDCNASGEYAERSAGNYNVVNNYAADEQTGNWTEKFPVTLMPN